MNAFDFHAPTSVAEAQELLARHGADAVAMAGGTSVVVLMKQGLLRPAHVVSLRALSEWRRVERTDGALRLGGLATLRELERSPLVRQTSAALASAFGAVATVRIRNQATLGGALAHADPAQDPPVMLLALDAEVETTSRRIRLADFFVDVLATILESAELIVAARVPSPPPGSRSIYLKFLPRTDDDYATVSVGAVAARSQDGRITHLRVALGAAGPTAIRARAVENALAGSRPRAKDLADAAALVRDEVDPFDDLRGTAAYKREMARVWTERALRAVLV